MTPVLRIMTGFKALVYFFFFVFLPLLVESGEKRMFSVGSTDFMVIEEDGWFLGLGGLRFEDESLQVSDSLIFPLLADEWAEIPMVAGVGRLKEVERVDAGVVLKFAWYGGEMPVDWQEFFLWDSENETVARDDYRFARTRPLAEINRRGARSKYVRERGDHLLRVGTLWWEIQPFRDTVAGWPWEGWQWRVRFVLEDGRQTNAMRMIGGLEAGGQLAGLTLANQRYRGLGDLEQRLEADRNGLSRMTFNTQDSFARPSPLPEGFQSGNSAYLSREQALGIRENSWIHTMARGAGTSFFDFQYADRLAIRSHPPRQGNFRALTEIYPGDVGVGQSNEEHFGYQGEFAGEWMQYAVLRQAEKAPENFWRTRYLEVDRELRTRVSEELGMSQDRVVPSVGYLFDFWQATDNFARVVARMSGYASYLSELGVGRVMTHNPGWKNGRAFQRGWDGADPENYIGGGVNNIYDWKLLPRVKAPWREVSEIYDHLGIEHYVWLSGMSRSGGRFTREVGLEPANWALNSPDGHPNDTYGEIMLKHNILSPRFKEVWNARFDDLQELYGFSGYWGDSFQNLMMSQLNWAGGNGEPLQRAWWKWLAEQSQKGRGWISESHSFPGISCSIETENWEKTPWMMGQVIRWLRGTEQETKSPHEWRRLLFRVMAFEGWLAPEIWPYYADREVDPENVIEDFGILSWSFRAASPMMVQPWVLEEGKGVLWTNPEFPGEAVIFPFQRIRLPEGVRGHPILENTGQTYPVAGQEVVTRLYGEYIPKRLGMVLPPKEESAGTFVTREASLNLPEKAERLYWRPNPGNHRRAYWGKGLGRWANEVGEIENWPVDNSPRAVFSSGIRTVLELQGKVRTAGLLTKSPGVELVIPTVVDGERGALLESSGSLAGPLKIFFKGTLREGGNLYSPGRERTGLRLRGGNAISLGADLLPWPGDFHHHSQIVSVSDPGTTVHFYGSWPATGELSRPGLILGEGTRFVVWPEAELPFIKNYGGFTLQLWVGRGEDGGGVLELHDGFVADRSRQAVNPFAPESGDLRLGSLGSIRLNGVTLLSHHSQNLPITGREQNPLTGSIQNNGHLVFEYPYGARWEVRTRPQSYRGAVWIDADTTIHTDRDLTLLGETEKADQTFGYIAANAFQTRWSADRVKGPVKIVKTGPAALILAGEQAYVQESELEIREGAVVFQSDPLGGGRFPSGEPFGQAHLAVLVEDEAKVVWDSPRIHLSQLQVSKGGRMKWSPGSVVEVRGRATLEGSLWAQDFPIGETLVLRADELLGVENLVVARNVDVRQRNVGGRYELIVNIKD
ncbi:MAG: hypothetical protein LAT55_07630 [Opitutales bacterium]|nr:hypothetical protein [Opitutales bacterium]